MAENAKLGGVKFVSKTRTDYRIEYDTGEHGKLNILNNHVFRYYISPTGEFLDYPEPHNPEDVAKINAKKVTDYNTEAFMHSSLTDNDEFYIVNTNKIQINFDKVRGTMKIYDKRSNKVVLNESEAFSYADYEATQTLYQNKDEYYFGGGMQNCRFSHKGEVIDILNTNNWVDGGVASPCPFYWSSYGYGLLRNTWQPGVYDFGSKSLNIVKTIHEGEYFDAFYFINAHPKDILNDYCELTGQPLLMPEYAYYEAHLNAFNRDYWVKVDSNTPGAILFEDGEHYKCYQPNSIGDKNGILESLNGEKNNYQFSARAMIDRYKRHDMPLGWFVPNDGYGSGYGQTDSLDGDIKNLKEFADYSRANGVETALWTESNLSPADPQNPQKGERDLGKEVSVAGVVALKCDVAWIGSGYSFGLNDVENAANIFTNASNHRDRPMIIMVDGWAGTQRYAGIWSGDQTGGQWEYIRFHIPTYIGTGLSGQPIVGSDMDGIYGGKDKEVNIRDYQWKTFTPLQLNMDGWGNIPKTPFSFDREATNINRAYLKLKSMLMPYNYSIGHESIQGLPMIRAMFLEFPEETLAYTNDCKYQFMWGPSILVAPIYNEKNILGESIRNVIYLPNQNQVWIDFFTGEKYQGGKVINNVKTPLWKLPVFIRDGAIIPVTNPNNNPYEIKRDVRMFTLYPNGKTNFDVYEDDGISSDYLEGDYATTKITTIGPKSNRYGDLFIDINKTKGTYKNMVKERTTVIQIMASKDAEQIKAAINGKPIHISKVETDKEFQNKENIYYLKKDFIINPYLNPLVSTSDVLQQRFLLIKIQQINVISDEIQIKIKGYANKSKVFGSNSTVSKDLNVPNGLTANEKLISPTSITLQWELVEGAVYYEIERDGTLFSNIIGSTYTFEGFKYESEHSFRIRSANENFISMWSETVTATTKEDPYKHTVKVASVSCNIPPQPSQEICNLINGELRSVWHTHWSEQGKVNFDEGQFIKLDFDLGDVYELDQMEYVPRDDAGNGTFLQIQYKFSSDGKTWSPLSNKIYWETDASFKRVELNGAKLRFIELNVLNTVGSYGSGKQIFFYKRVN